MFLPNYTMIFEQKQQTCSTQSQHKFWVLKCARNAIRSFIRAESYRRVGSGTGLPYPTVYPGSTCEAARHTSVLSYNDRFATMYDRSSGALSRGVLIIELALP